MKYLHEKLPNKSKLGLYFNPYGKVTDLIDDCISCGIDKLMAEHGGPAWTEQGFNQLREEVRAHLNETVVAIAIQVEKILTCVFQINKRLKGKVDMNQALALSDIKTQMAGLVYRGFVTAVTEGVGNDNHKKKPDFFSCIRSAGLQPEWLWQYVEA